MQLNNLVIRQVENDEVYSLQQICIHTFMETFADCNTEADMKQYLDESFSITKLQRALNNKEVVYYYALMDDEIVGYLKMNGGMAQTDVKDDRAIEIERIYVLKKFHGCMIGKALLEQAIDYARQKNADYIWLGVWEKNERAINFYQKNGFVEFGKHVFKLGLDVQQDLMMKIAL